MPSRNDLHKYQHRMIDFIYNTPTCALWAGLGLGKTITTITAIVDLLDSMTVSKVLIIAPLRVANSVWHKEAVNWQHTKHLKFSIVTGSEKERLAALHKTADGQYVLVGNTFMRLPSSLAGPAEKWRQHPVTRIGLQNIPEFFQRDLVLLKMEFTAVLTDMASKIQIIDKPFKPVVKVDKGERGWLDFEVNYEAGGFTLPHDILSKATGQPYLQLDDVTWIKMDPQASAKTQREIKEFEAEMTANGYRIQASHFASLEEFIKNIGGKGELSATYQQFLEQLTGFKADETFRLSMAEERPVEKLGIFLRPYKRAGIN